MRRAVVAMTPMMDSAAGRSVRLPTSVWPARGVGHDRSNGPFDEPQGYGTNDPSNRNGRRGQVYSGLVIECNDGCAGPAFWRRIEGVGDVSVIGRVGSLIVATRGVAGPGEVLLNVRGAKEAYLAWSDQPLPRGTEVLVIDIRGARTVLVEPWTLNFTA